jgi:methionine-rich copper-binding protein CopC
MQTVTIKAKQRVALFVALIMILGLWAGLPMQASAATAGAFTITSGGGGDPQTGTDYTYGAGILTITSGKSMTISMANNAAATTDRIVINSADAANITIENVKITGSGNSPLSLADGTSATLKLAGANSLTSGGDYAGLNAPIGTTLTITSAAGDGSSEGSLTTKNRLTEQDDGAGIGGNGGQSAGTITIKGGTITAESHFDNESDWSGGGAGIGGGTNGAGGNLTIEGGTVNIIGGISTTRGGSGIGGGTGGSGGNITISGGMIMASISGGGGSGIGGGRGANSGVINISGGTIVVDSPDDAPIGNGDNAPPSGTINISGGTIITSGDPGRGIGVGVGLAPAVHITGNPVIFTTMINKYFSDPSRGIVIGNDVMLTPENKTIILNKNVTIPEGATLTVPPGFTLDVNGHTLTNNDTIVNFGKIVDGNKPYVAAGDGSYATYFHFNNQPQNLKLTEGFITQKLWVAASVMPGIRDSETPHYQWYTSTTESRKDGTPLDGATAQTFALPQDLKAGTYYYYAVVSTADLKESFSSHVAAVTVQPPAFTVTADGAGEPTGADYTYDGLDLIITSNKAMTIAMADSAATTAESTIVIDGTTENGEANITLDDVKVDVSETENACAFNVDASTLNLTLTGDNILKSGTGKAGLQLINGAHLNITEASGTNKLTATSQENAAGIGGTNSSDPANKGGNITIAGGNITAQSDLRTERGLNNGAGIGGGNEVGGAVGNITITGGAISGRTFGGIGVSGGAGIGAGASSADCGNITITGGTLTANAEGCGAKIGAGASAKAAHILITGGTLTGMTAGKGAGIGGGFSTNASKHASVDSITIEGGRITGVGGDDGAAIGGGRDYAPCGVIKITGGTITAGSNNFSCQDIGNGNAASGRSNASAVTIDGGSIWAVNSKVTPAPKNSAGTPVYANKLSFNPAVADNTVFIAGSINDVDCVTAVPTADDTAAGVYGIKDVKAITDPSADSDKAVKACLWLPGADVEETVMLAIANIEYKKSYLRAGIGIQTQTLTGLSYILTSDPEEKDFGSRQHGYDMLNAQGFTLTNSGTGQITNLTASIGDADESGFEISGALSKNTLDANEEALVSVRPRTGLAAGKYTDTLTIFGSNGTHIEIELSFEVTDTYMLTSGLEEKDFGSQRHGYAMLTAQEFTITNSGTGQVMDLTASLGNAAESGFEISSALSRNTLDTNETAMVSVRPRTGLAVGKYTDTLTITGSSGTRAEIELRFEVTDSYLLASDSNEKDFGSQRHGYDTLTAQEFTITNSGTGAIANLAAFLGGTVESDFEISSVLSKHALDANGTAVVSVRPRTGLAVGTYTDTLTIFGSNDVYIEITLSFEVTDSYMLTSDPEEKDFGSQRYGYEMLNAQEFTLTNTGTGQIANLTASLGNAAESGFEISGALSKNALDANGTAMVSVWPRTGLAVGTHTDTLTIFGSDGARVEIELSFAVTDTYMLTSDPKENDFGTQQHGYDMLIAQEFTLTNTGTGKITNLTASLGDAAESGFEISSALSKNSLDANGTATLSVRPRAGLPVGTYTDTLTITGSGGTHVEIELSFAVTDTYMLTSDPKEKDFGSQQYGYETLTAQEFTLTNTGTGQITNLTASLGDAAESGFEISSALSKNALDANGTATLSVRPRTGLAVGTHTDTLTITGSSGTHVEIALSFEVTKPDDPQKYVLTVTNGTGGGSYEAAETVSITANAAPDGQIFDAWTSADGVTFANANSVTTTFSMPAKDVTVTATYKKAPATANDITSFTINDAVGTIDGTTIAVEVPAGTDVTALAPAIEISAGASVSPASGAAQDFTNPRTYTVTAEDGTEKTYTVTVTVASVADGWVYEDGVWKYFIDGEAKTGWLYDTGYKAWFYLGSDGSMQTGWEYDGGEWYYLAPNGEMHTGWVKDKNSWYYLAGNGVMAANRWLHDDGSWYYLSSSGKMLTGKQRIGGETYTFKSNGVWVS